MIFRLAFKVRFRCTADKTHRQNHVPVFTDRTPLMNFFLKGDPKALLQRCEALIERPQSGTWRN